MTFINIEESTTDALHPNWSQHWDPTVNDTALRDALFRDPDTRLQIKRDLQNHHMWHDCPECLPNEEMLPELGDLTSQKSLRQIGLAWLAPNLAVSLFDKRYRLPDGDITQQDVEDILSFRDHCDPVPLSDEVDTKLAVAEGRKCIIAWLLGIPSEFARGCLLQVDPEDVKTIDYLTERADLCSAFSKRRLEKSYDT